MIDPILLRGIERIAIVLVAGLFAWLGYRLFMHGHAQGESKMSLESPWAKVVFSGTGAGLIFMAFGALVLVYALIFGGIRTSERNTVQTLQEDVAELKQDFKEVEMLMHRSTESPPDKPEADGRPTDDR